MGEKMKIKWPVVLRKTMEERLHYKNGDMDRMRKDHRIEMEELKKQLDAHLPKLFKIDIRHVPEFGNYMIQLRLSTGMIRECFFHGDSQFMISMVSERLAHQLEHELKTINFARLGEERPYGEKGGMK